MIPDAQLLSAIEFDGASAGELRACTERALIAEGNLKRVKAMEMRRHDHLPLGAQEREAYASEAYEVAMIEEARAAAALEHIKAARAHARLTIEIWRALEGSHRTVSRYP